jgi:PTH2 family peptidyl-tRNA hydrolase
MENITPKQVIVLRKDLNMRKGKMTAQGSHASIGVIFNYMTPNYLNPGEMTRTFTITLPEGELGEFMYKWMTGMFKKVVVGVNSLEELKGVYNAAKEAGIPCSIIQDNGLTEFGGVPTYTSVAIGPDNPEKIDKITGTLNLL